MPISGSDQVAPRAAPEPPSRGGIAAERTAYLASLSTAELATACADTMVRATGHLPRQAPGPPKIGPRLAPPALRPTEAVVLGSAALSERELEVLEAAASGVTRRAVGQRLYISEKTVSNHLSRIYKKLGVTNRMAAVVATMGPAATAAELLTRSAPVDSSS